MFDFERLLVVGPGPTHSASFDMHPRAWDIDDGTIHVRLNLRWEAWDIALYARNRGLELLRGLGHQAG